MENKTPKLKEKYSNDSYKLNYVVDKELFVSDNKEIKLLSDKNIHAYILKEDNFSYKFLMLSLEKYSKGKIIKANTLTFYSHEQSETAFFNISELENKTKFIKKVGENDKHNFSFMPFDSTKKIKGSEGTKVYYHENYYKIHTKSFCVENPFYFKKYITTKKLNNEYIMNEIKNNAKIDLSIETILKSQFFHESNNERMSFQSHALILTQGKTGKSSILGKVGHNMDTTSDSGIYGYYDVKKGLWVSGEIDKNECSLVFDEMNEKIKNEQKPLDNLNTGLENGTYTNSKAGGKNLKFGTQFLFLGNISPECTFENVIAGMFNNVETCGRRFAFVVYDDKAHFEPATTMYDKNLNEFLFSLKSLSSYVYKYVILKKWDSYLMQNQKVKDLMNTYAQKYKTIANKIEGSCSKKFIQSFSSGSLNRLFYLAFKVNIFDNLEIFYEHLNDLTKIPKFEINRKFLIKFEDILKLQERYFNNIEEHLNVCGIKENTGIKTSLHNKLKQLSKFETNLFYTLAFNKDKIKNNTVLRNDLEFITQENKRQLQYLIRDMKKFEYQKNNKLSQFGVKYIEKEEQGIFIITNNNLFNATCEYFFKTKEELDKKEIKNMKIIE